MLQKKVLKVSLLAKREGIVLIFPKLLNMLPTPLKEKVISQVLSKPWPVVSAIIHPLVYFLVNFVLPISKVSHN